MILFSEFHFKYDQQIFLYMNNLIEDFIICCKVNNIHKFISRMKQNENNVYTYVQNKTWWNEVTLEDTRGDCEVI